MKNPKKKPKILTPLTRPKRSDSFVSFGVAGNMISVTKASFYGANSGKYLPFIRDVKDSIRLKEFNVDWYYREEDFKEELKEKVKLLICYLREERGIKLKDIARVGTAGATSLTVIHNLAFGYKVAEKILRNIGEDKPEWIRDFDTFYGWRREDAQVNQA